MTPEAEILTVSDVTASVKSLIENSFPLLCVTGEVSNFRPHTSGHWYFSLKDAKSQLPCAMFRRQNQGVPFLPENGMQVIAQGALSVYEPKGEYQLVAHRLQPVGEGALAVAFEQLKSRLEGEGLFDAGRKRPLPSCPERVGVVTSASGAAIRDIIRVLHRRAPWVEIVLRPVPVQGAGAGTEIARGIEEMNAFGEVDVLIVGRGGGAMEDLWAFNEEAVVRAIVASRIPVVSGVGHEIDVTLADLAADVRASTPSNAAERVVPDRQDLLDRVAGAFGRLLRALTNQIHRRRQRLDALTSSYGIRRPLDLVGQRAQQVDDLSRRLVEQWHRLHEQQHQRLSSLSGRLDALSPLAVLERGYAVCRTSQDGRLIRDAATLRVGDRLEVTFHKGHAGCRVEHLDGRPEGQTPQKARPAVPGEPIRLTLFDDP
jgi:exodeoxyribonuclease VII large subunit